MLRKTDSESIAPYLRDASNFSGGSANEVIIPEDIDDLISFLKSNRDPITISGAGTGVTASRIPLSGKIVSLEKFNRIGEVNDDSIEVGAAVSLSELQKLLQRTKYFYPPNPTETLASLGGTLATNASGSRSYKFGSTRDFVLESQIVLADGRTARVRRGEKITGALRLDDGSSIDFPRIKYKSPPFKNAAGYFVAEGMDWLDLFIGSDGTLVMFAKAILKLLPVPAEFISAILFFEEEEFCWKLVERIRDCRQDEISPCSLEYFDRFSLERLREHFSGVPSSSKAALFFEQGVMDEGDYDRYLEAWHDFLSREDVLLEDSWFAQSSREIKRFHDFRHRLPLLINEENSRLGRVKIGTDMAVSNGHFMDMMRFYKETLTRSGLGYVVFGHIGDNHLHINLLPDSEKGEQARNIYQKLVEKILGWGGTVSAEHGIGKLKKDYFASMVGREALGEMRAIKKLFDPKGLLGRGNLF